MVTALSTACGDAPRIQVSCQHSEVQHIAVCAAHLPVLQAGLCEVHLAVCVQLCKRGQLVCWRLRHLVLHPHVQLSIHSRHSTVWHQSRTAPQNAQPARLLAIAAPCPASTSTAQHPLPSQHCLASEQNSAAECTASSSAGDCGTLSCIHIYSSASAPVTALSGIRAEQRHRMHSHQSAGIAAPMTASTSTAQHPLPSQVWHQSQRQNAQSSSAIAAPCPAPHPQLRSAPVTALLASEPNSATRAVQE